MALNDSCTYMYLYLKDLAILISISLEYRRLMVDQGSDVFEQCLMFENAKGAGTYNLKLTLL